MIAASYSARSDDPGEAGRRNEWLPIASQHRQEVGATLATRRTSRRPLSARRGCLKVVLLDENSPLLLHHQLRIAGYAVEHFILLGQRSTSA